MVVSAIEVERVTCVTDSDEIDDDEAEEAEDRLNSAAYAHHVLIVRRRLMQPGILR